ncbi:hypothetical protein TSOC_007624, partial [Tetrabaena socialis]
CNTLCACAPQGSTTRLHCTLGQSKPAGQTRLQATIVGLHHAPASSGSNAQQRPMLLLKAAAALEARLMPAPQLAAPNGRVCRLLLSSRPL